MLRQKDSVQLRYSNELALKGTKDFDCLLKREGLSKIMYLSVLVAVLALKEVHHIQILVDYCLRQELYLRTCEKLG